MPGRLPERTVSVGDGSLDVLVCQRGEDLPAALREVIVRLREIVQFADHLSPSSNKLG